MQRVELEGSSTGVFSAGVTTFRPPHPWGVLVFVQRGAVILRTDAATVHLARGDLYSFGPGEEYTIELAVEEQSAMVTTLLLGRDVTLGSPHRPGE